MGFFLSIWLVLGIFVGSIAGLVTMEHYGKNYDGVYRLSLENFMCGMFLWPLFLLFYLYTGTIRNIKKIFRKLDD